jgi:hypothetical protein
MGFGPNPEYSSTLSDPSALWGLSSHIVNVHSDRSLSNCGQQCPIQYPGLHTFCPLPKEDGMPAVGYGYPGPYNLYGNGENLSANFTPCGANTLNGTGFLNHFYTMHYPNQFEPVRPSQDSGSISLSASPFGPPKEIQDRSPPFLDFDNQIKQSSPVTPFSSREPESVEITTRRHDSAVELSTGASSPESTTSGPEGDGICSWRDPDSKDRCGRHFADEKELHEHVLKSHIRNLEKGDQGYICCWQDCKRSCGEKPGFSQRSKIERHMQTHVGCTRRTLHGIMKLPC